MSHPLQPLVRDEHGVVRFKANAIVRFLAKGRLNELTEMPFSDEDREQLMMLIGYSVDGFGELSFVSDAMYEAAAAQAETLGVE